MNAHYDPGRLLLEKILKNNGIANGRPNKIG